MNITKKIEIDILNRGAPPVVDIVQGDANSRYIEIHFFANGQPWPLNTAWDGAVNYERPDGFGGAYDEANGTPAVAISDNVATVTIAPIVTEKGGRAKLSVTFSANGRVASSFPIALNVVELPGYESDEPPAVSKSYLPQPASANKGDLLVVGSVAGGKVTSVVAVAPSNLYPNGDEVEY